jgi:hypothetical protein
MARATTPGAASSSYRRPVVSDRGGVVVSRNIRSIVTVVVILGVSAGAFFLAYREAMKRAIVKYGEYDIRSEGNLVVGDLAPDLELERLDGAGRTKLSALYADKPLVLLFGSYT